MAIDVAARPGLVTALDDLRHLIPQPPADSGVIRKERTFLDAHCRNFIAKSPMALLSTSSASGRCDASPRGDGAGFAAVLDERTLILPDRPGNRRVDSMTNILENGHVGLLFIIPNVNETLRVNGTAWLTTDPELLAPLQVQGKDPKVGIVVEVEETFFHCARAFLRGKVWTPETWIDRKELPTLGQIMADQFEYDVEVAREIDADLAISNERLY